MLYQRLFKLANLPPKTLLNKLVNYVHHDGSYLPKQHNLQFKPFEKKLLFSKKNKLIPLIQMEYNDQLLLQGYNQRNILQLLKQFQARKVPLSPTNLCKLIHMFTKHNVMTDQCFDIIQKQAYRLRGQYKVRSIFGAQLGSIIYNRTNLLKFFLKQYEMCSQKFTMQEALEIMQALVGNNQIEIQKTKQIWKQYFRADFLDGLYTFKIALTPVVCRVFDLMTDLQQEDAQVWKRLIHFMRKKHRWSRIPIIQRLYPISGKFPEAKALFDDYFNKMAQDELLVQRYNLTELRYRTPLQIIKYVQENPSDYQPKIRTLIPEGEDAAEWNAKYEQYLTVGVVKQEELIIKDKSKSLGFAIRDRYENLEADGLDFSKMSKQEFEDMFGDYSQTMKTIELQDARIAEMQKQKEEVEEVEEEKEQKGKGKKGRGKGKGEGEGGESIGKQKKSKKKQE